MLPADTARTWTTIAPLVPLSSYLVGGTGLTVHLQHRVSRELDFFLERREDLSALWSRLQDAGDAVADELSIDTLNCTFHQTKVQFLEASTQRLLLPTTSVAGIRVASIEDIMATKVAVLSGRSALRDYFDLMRIEQQTGLLVDVGIALAVQKYDPSDRDAFILRTMRALGSFDDVADDPSLPVTRKEIASYWTKRLYDVAKRFSSFGGAS